MTTLKILSTAIVLFIFVLLIQSCGGTRDAVGHKNNPIKKCRNRWFVGAYNVKDTCTNGTYAYVSNITASATDVHTIVISNFGGFKVNINAILNDCGTFTIPKQTDALGRTFVGLTSGIRNATTGQFSFTYRVTFSDNTFEGCASTFTTK